VAVRPGEPNKNKSLAESSKRPKILKIALWQQRWQQSAKFIPLASPSGHEARTPSNAKAAAAWASSLRSGRRGGRRIAGTRDTLLPLKLSSGPQPGGRLSLQGFGTGETPLVWEQQVTLRMN
jgi:hypothetical protein